MATRRNILANYVGGAFSALLAIAFVPVYIRYLGAEAYGVIALYVALQACLAVVDLGMKPTMTREAARYGAGELDERAFAATLRALELLSGAIACLFAAAWALSAPLIARDWLRTEGLDPDGVAASLALMGAVAAIRFVEGLYAGALVGLQRQVLHNAIGVAVTASSVLGAVAVLAFVRASLEAFFLWQLLVYALSLAVRRALLPAPVRQATSATDARASLARVWRFAAGMTSIGASAVVLTQLDRIVLSGLVPLSELAYYSLAVAAASVIGLAVSPITQAFYPRLVAAATRGDAQALDATDRLGLQLVAAATAASMALLCLFPTQIVLVWSGDSGLAARVAPVLPVVAAGAFLNAVVQPRVLRDFARGSTRLAALINAAAVLVMVPALLWVAPRFGILGAAYCWLALNVVYAIVFLGARALDIAFPVAAALVVAGAAAFGGLHPAQPEARLAWACALLAIGATALVASVAAASLLRPLAARALLRALRPVHG